MIDDKDIEKLREVFVTKEEFESFMETAPTKNDVNKILDLLGKMDEKLINNSDLKQRVEYIENTLNITALKTKS
jgi:hypothetical protein